MHMVIFKLSIKSVHLNKEKIKSRFFEANEIYGKNGFEFNLIGFDWGDIAIPTELNRCSNTEILYIDFC